MARKRSTATFRVPVRGRARPLSEAERQRVLAELPAEVREALEAELAARQCKNGATR